MWNRAGSPARRIVEFGPRGGRTQNGGTNGPRVFDLRSSMGAISEGRRESAGEGMAEVSGRTRSSREHDRSLRARPGLLSRFSGDRKYPVSLGHSSDDRSLHSEHHSARGSEGFEKGDGGKKHSRERHSATAPHSGSPLS